VHLGPGVTSTRRTNPAIDLHELPRIDMVLLSHYHADHFDEKVGEFEEGFAYCDNPTCERVSC